MWYVPIAFVTGQKGRNVKALLNQAQMLFKQSRTRISTPDLNRVLRAALDQNPPPMSSGKRPKIYYATQVAAQPPTIVFFCNSPQSITAPYRRYLLGVFRDQFEFGEVPIKLYLRRRETKEQRDVANAEFDPAASEAFDRAAHTESPDIEADEASPG
jgi:GTP-binding protein